ncbi:MAG: hypothetical protein HY875_17045 [Chloroflexi bacterium]|nr:hypothetical protein [Chloroflexota bacterium]
MTRTRASFALVALAVVAAAAVVPFLPGGLPTPGHTAGEAGQERVVVPLLARDAPGEAIPTPDPPRATTSLDLINEARDTGKISADQATIYRFYAVFEDPRLPAAYRGDDTGVFDAPLLDEEFAAAPPATQDLLRPFMLRPDNPESWVNTTQAGYSEQALGEVTAAARPTGAWLSESGSLVRVWYPDWGAVPQTATLRAKALATVNETESLVWPKLKALLGREPPADCLLLCGDRGGDSLYDIYLVNIDRSATFREAPYLCTGVTSYILLNPTDKFSTLAHELMHSFQNAFPQLGGCDEYRWLKEATAQWAIDYVYGQTYNADEQIADWYLADPRISLEFKNDVREYGAYVFFFYLTRIGAAPPVIKAMWQAAASNSDSLKAVEDSIPDGFNKHFPEFARYNWNDTWSPLNRYRLLDALTDRVVPQHVTPVSIGGAPFKIYDMPDTPLKHLSSYYEDYSFGADVSTIAFFNGFTYDLTLEQMNDMKIFTQTELDGNAPNRKHGKVQALLKYAGKDWQVADWSDKPAVMFCRDDPNNRLERLVIIFSDSDYQRTSPPLQPGNLKAKLFTSSVGCWRWQGTATFTSSDNVYKITANVTWQATSINTGGPGVIPASAGTKYGALGQNFTPLQGTITWTASGTDGSGCTHSGSKTFQFLGQSTIFNFIFISNLVPEGEWINGYVGEGQIGSTKETVNCPGGDGPEDVIEPKWFWLVAGSETGLLHVSADGRKLTGSVGGNGDDRWTWNFTALK